MVSSILDLRFARPVLYSTALTFGMFLSMQLLITGGKYSAEEGATLATVDFVRLKKDTDLTERERKKPPKPEPPKTPPPPRMKIETPPPDSTPVPFKMPKLDLSANVSGGPFLGAVASGDASGYSDLIPVMRIAPQYPRAAARDGITGYVVFELIINPDGTVRSAKPIDAKPRGVFESAGMQAIMKWKFRPKMEEGKPVETRGTQKVDFNLEDE